MLIAEKWANRSSPPPSGVMNPKPFASLNHLTVPVAICNVPKKIEKGLSPKHRVESLSPKNEPQTAVLAEPKPVQGAGPYPGVFHKSTTILVESTTMLPKRATGCRHRGRNVLPCSSRPPILRAQIGRRLSHAPRPGCF